MDISWDDAQTFLAIAEAGSISGGAQKLGLGQPTVSRRIALLEERLGLSLFVRSKLGVELTDAALRLRPAAEQMARWASELERLASGEEEEATGTVRIAAPPAMAVDWLAGLAAELSQDHPALQIEVLASVDHIDLVRGEADLALRTRPTNEPELMTLAEGVSSVGVFASPAYAEALAERRARDGRREAQITFADLDWVTWAKPYEQVAPRPMLERTIPDFVPAFASDDFLVQRAATVAGMGAMILDFRGAERVGLVPIDVEFNPPPNTFRLVCAKSMQFVPRVRLVAERVIETIRSISGPK